jgi:hypothetical protein
MIHVVFSPDYDVVRIKEFFFLFRGGTNRQTDTFTDSLSYSVWLYQRQTASCLSEPWQIYTVYPEDDDDDVVSSKLYESTTVALLVVE